MKKDQVSIHPTKIRRADLHVHTQDKNSRRKFNTHTNSIGFNVQASTDFMFSAGG